MNTHVVIPFRSFSTGKSRLSEVLGPAQRRCLCIELLAHTVDISMSFQHVWVVSDDTDVADFLSRRGSRARSVTAPSPGDLNAAIGYACQCIPDDASVLVLPTDLPWLEVAELVEFAASTDELRIAPDHSGQGTNLLLIPGTLRPHFVFSFGPGSFERHVSTALAIDAPLRIWRTPASEFDLDSPLDLARAQMRDWNVATARCPLGHLRKGVTA